MNRVIGGAAPCLFRNGDELSGVLFSIYPRKGKTLLSQNSQNFVYRKTSDIIWIAMYNKGIASASV